MSNYIIGLTGGIASGKSAVSARFAALGVSIADADLAARSVVAPGQPALAAIAERFGNQVLQDDGQLDRAALRRIVFADPLARSELEAITHPAIRAEMIRLCQQANSPYAIAAIPLLAEAGRKQYPWINRILVIDVPSQIQLQRLIARDDIDADLARAMIAAQANRSTRLALADDILDNSGSPDDLDDPIAALHARYLALANATA
jgi:dephospho-CoA kinase